MYFWILAFLIIFADQLSKFIIDKNMILGTSLPVLGSFFRITLVKNPGVAFGLRFGSHNLFIYLSIFVMLGVVYLFFKSKNSSIPVKFSLIAILSGAAGNLIDRIHYGKVTDFLDFGIGNLRWPVFNIADISVTLGAILLVLISFMGKKYESGDNCSPGPGTKD